MDIHLLSVLYDAYVAAFATSWSFARRSPTEFLYLCAIQKTKKKKSQLGPIWAVMTQKGKKNVTELHLSLIYIIKVTEFPAKTRPAIFL